VIQLIRVNAEESEPTAPEPPVIRLNLRALVGDNIKEYQRGVRAGLAAVVRDADAHKALLQLKGVQQGTLEEVVGNIKVPGYGSKDGTAQAWCKDPETQKQMRLKRAALRKYTSAPCAGKGGERATRSGRRTRPPERPTVKCVTRRSG
jgi:hypothetical protein